MWVPRGPSIIGEDVHDMFGTSVSLSADGNIFAAGAPLNGATIAGHTRVFAWNADRKTRYFSDRI